jgi:hypothetical protein
MALSMRTAAMAAAAGKASELRTRVRTAAPSMSSASCSPSCSGSAAPASRAVQSLQLHVRWSSHHEETSIAQEAAKAAPAGVSVVKAFNTIFRHVLEKGRPDVFIAGDSVQAKALVEAFIAARPRRGADCVFAETAMR